MLRVFFTALVLTIISCSKKVITTEVLPEPQKDKAMMVFPVEESPKVEAPAVPMETFKQTVIVYFKFDSDELQDSERWKIVNIDKPVELVGGTCPIGGDDYNYTLGLRRAYSVKKLFDQNYVKVESVKSVGEKELVTTDKSEYRLNRRCEIKY